MRTGRNKEGAAPCAGVKSVSGPAPAGPVPVEEETVCERRHSASSRSGWEAFNREKLPDKLILFAPSRKFGPLCFGRLGHNFELARDYAMNWFAEKLYLPGLSETQEAYFLASYPDFSFAPSQKRALTELMHMLERNAGAGNAAAGEEYRAVKIPERIRGDAHRIIQDHTNLPPVEKTFMETLGSFQKEYREDYWTNLHIRYLTRQKDPWAASRNWDIAFNALFNRPPADVRHDYLISFGLGRIPPGMNTGEWRRLVLANLKTRANVSNPADVLFISDDAERVRHACNMGYFVYLLQRTGFDMDGLLEYIRDFLFIPRKVFGAKRGGKGKGRVSDFIFIAPTV